jgi:hypothetical protein
MATKYIAPRGLKEKGDKPYWERETVQKAADLSSQHKVSRSGFGGQNSNTFDGLGGGSYEYLGEGSYRRKKTSSD